MLPIKKILCPIDFSIFSLEALGNARELAANFSAELCLLHVTQTISAPYGLEPYAGEMLCNQATYEKSVRAAAQHEMEKAIKRSYLQEIRLRTLLRDGNPTDEIISAAKDEQVDMIVIATHGLSGWRHLVFGSVAEKVIRLASCPVLVTHTTNTRR